MNLRQGYNNVRINEEDEQNVAFSIPEEVFKPMIMFFGLTNSLATFQAIMNDLLRDIIEVEDVVVFIDDIIIATETEEEYDNIIEKVLRRIVKNNLFVNLEKHV